MKQSPLQLDWIIFQKASFEANLEADSEAASQSADIEAFVKFCEPGPHLANLSLRSKDSPESRYKFEAELFCRFSLDLQAAKAAYRSQTVKPEIIATNAIRLLYGAAREYLAQMTSRGPYNAVLVESQYIEPSDIAVVGDKPYEEMLISTFGWTSEQVAQHQRQQVGTETTSSRPEAARIESQNEGAAGKRDPKK